MKIEGYIFGDWALCSGIHKEAGACKAFITLDAREIPLSIQLGLLLHLCRRRPCIDD